MRNTLARAGRLQRVGDSVTLDDLSSMLTGLGVVAGSTVVLRITRSEGSVRAAQLIHPTQKVDPRTCNSHREALDKLDVPSYGVASLEFVVDEDGGITRIKKLSLEETVDLGSLP